MKTQNWHEMASEQLVRRFVEIGIAQAHALLRNEIAKCNRLFDEKTALLAELKSRPGDQRRLLLPLFDHENVQVRLSAAKATLAVEPAAARRMLETIAAKSRGPQGGDAGMCIDALDRGIFKPT